MSRFLKLKVLIARTKQCMTKIKDITKVIQFTRNSFLYERLETDEILKFDLYKQWYSYSKIFTNTESLISHTLAHQSS